MAVAPDVYFTYLASNQLLAPSKTKLRIVAGHETSCNGLNVFTEFLVPREAVCQEKGYIEMNMDSKYIPHMS